MFLAFSQVLKKKKISNMIPNAKFEINNHTMAISTITLNSNHTKIKQFHAKFCYLIKKRIKTL